MTSLSKKIILLVVEGFSDSRLLKAPLKKYFKEHYGNAYDVRFLVYGGDIFMDKLSTINDLGEKIKNKKEEIWQSTKNKDMAFASANLQAIFLITDTDACCLKKFDFVDTPSLHENNNGFYYDTENKKILYDGSKLTFNTNTRLDQLTARNTQKSYFLKTASRINQVLFDGHPVYFAMFYMSCNVDHVFFEDANSKNKLELAAGRADEYIKGSRSFKEDLALVGYKGCSLFFEEDMVKAWQFISKKSHSIERNTNLNLLLDAIDNKSLPLTI